MSENDNGSSTNRTPLLIAGIVVVVFCFLCAICSLVLYGLYTFGDVLFDGDIYFGMLSSIFSG